MNTTTTTDALPPTEDERAGIPGVSATYDPADNKLRIRCTGRLDSTLGPELYARVRATGFKWAARQDLFVAPAWSPEREELLVEIAGEVCDEDTSLVERADQRAERFEEYQENRKADAGAARQGVAAIADNIPLGQPILVGHHSERRARRDAERIRSGMVKTISLWRTAEYWARRAAGAKRHARYKELPAVRARRIKGLESEGRKWEAALKRASRLLDLWTRLHEPDSLKRKDGQPTTFFDRALHLANQNGADGWGTWSDLKDGKVTPEEVQQRCIPFYTAESARTARWVEHTQHRLAYERAMLADGGGLAADRFDLQPGGRVLRRGKWFPIAKVNGRNGKVISVTVVGHFATTVQVEEITDYRAPTEGDAEKVAAVIAKPPLCNYPGDGFRHMTKAEWDKRPKWSDAKTTETLHQTEKHGRHRVRCLPTRGWKYVNVFITDAKRTDPPVPSSAPEMTVSPEIDTASARADVERRARAAAAREQRQGEAAPFEAIAASLKTGVQVVAAPQLFPTPAPLAARMVEVADIQPGMRVLEPSAGTGAILRAIVDAEVARGRSGAPARVTAIEFNAALVRALPLHLAEVVRCTDFLREPAEGIVDAALFDRIVMNPPFEHGADIRHVRHAVKFLRAGGRLVALCADGPRQREQLRPEIEAAGGTWESLGDVGFDGTHVRVALVVVDKPAAAQADSAAA